MKLSRAALSAVIAALVVAGAALADEPKAPARKQLRIALEPLKASAMEAALVAAVEEQLCAEMARATGAEVVCPGDVAAAAEAARQGAIHGECSTDECLRRVDALKAADKRVSASLERGEGTLVLALQLVDREGSGGRVVEKLPQDVEGLFSRLPGAVRKLFPQK